MTGWVTLGIDWPGYVVIGQFHKRDLDSKYALIIRYISEINPACLDLVGQRKFHEWRKNKWHGIAFPV